MSEDEIERDNANQEIINRGVDRGWKRFWQSRGIDAPLACKDPNVGLWYSRAHGNEDCTGVYAHMLEPQELINRALTRKKILNQYR